MAEVNIAGFDEPIRSSEIGGNVGPSRSNHRRKNIRAGAAVRFRPALTLAVFAATTLVAADDIKLNVTYVCSGEHLYVENCNIRDVSDTSTCMVAHPDKPQHNGFMVYTYETRGKLKSLLPTCQQPTAKEIAAEEAFKKKQKEIYDAAVAKANPSANAPPPNQQPNGGGGQNQGAAGIAPPKNAEERALRRCVSSGRLPASCTGNSLLGAFSQMVSQVLPSAAKEAAAGPVMAGVFEGAGKWRLDFVDGGVLVNCSFLSPNEETYTIDLKSNHPAIIINTTPKPLMLALHADGTMTGPPGPVTIDGVIASGYVAGDTDAKYVDQYGNKYDAARNKLSNSNQGYSTFSHRRATCPALNLSSKGAGVGIQTMQTDLLKTAFGGDKGPPTPPGIRMQGIYAASTGFSAEFYPESVILGCGPDSARAYPYTVIAEGARASIKVDAPDRPLTLTFRPDGSLDAGSGPYLVHGRIVTGQNDDGDFTFAPMEQTCNLAVLAPSKEIPSSGGVAATMTAGGGSPNGGGTLSTPAAPLGNATLSIVSRLPAQPGTPNALAGRPLVLLRHSYAMALANGGAAIPQGMSPFKFVANTCTSRTPECQRLMDAVKVDAVSAVRADGNGSGVFPGVPPGTYYLMISARYNNQPLSWSQAVELKAGANSLALDQNNAQPIN